MPRVSARRQVLQALKGVSRHLLAHPITDPHHLQSANRPSSTSRSLLTLLLLPHLLPDLPLKSIHRLTLGLILKGQRGHHITDLELNKTAVEVWLAELESVENQRYLLSRTLRGRDHSYELFNGIMNAPEVIFIKVARMRKDNFIMLLHKIEDSKVFKNESGNPQEQVELQLLVTLCHLGLSGNGGQITLIGRLLGVSHGSVENYTWRCVAAILQLQPQYLRWPSPLERAKIRNEIAERYPALRGCVGFVDGTLIPLAFGPVICKEDYWTRKFFYALNSMIVCDHRRRITFARHGWCGSVHDQRVLRTSTIWCHPGQYFTEGEYLVADSGYSASKCTLPLFKRTADGQLPGLKHAFNKQLSEARTVIEHVNGMLKSRFQMLKECRLVLQDERSLKRINALLMACCVLHNFLLEQDEQSSFSYGLPNDAEREAEQVYCEENPAVVDQVLADNNDSLRQEVFAEYCHLMGHVV